MSLAFELPTVMGRSAPRGAMPGGRVGRGSARGAMPGGRSGITWMASGGQGGPCIARLSPPDLHGPAASPCPGLLCSECRGVVCSSGWLGWVGCLANTSKTCSSKVPWTCFAMPRMLSGMEMQRLQMDEERVLRNSV